MDITNLTIEQASTLASQITWFVGGAIILFFILAAINSKLGRANEFVSYAPNLLTSLGIFGTFAGIVVGLMAFDASDIDGSVTGLLNGLKTAFITSIVGIAASILYKLLHSTSLIRPSKHASVVNSATPEDILSAIREQKSSIDSLIKSIGGEGDASVVSQMKLLRSDLSDNQKQSLNFQKESSESLTKISEQLSTQQEAFSEFKDKLWIKMQDFADMLSKSATETVIEALKQVITDFNNNLTEQFGENFKQLNEAVKELVQWQENYKQQISEMTEQYKLGVASISATEQSVSKISTESKVIPESMENLKEVMVVNQHQLAELERHLDAFKDIRDRAVEAVPEIRKQIDETVNTIAESVEKASSHYNQLLTESDKYIQSHISSSNELLEKFVSNTNEGVSIIGEKLADSASKVEKVITEGANDFTEKVHHTNSSLQTTADHITSQTEMIKDHLKDTVEDLNNHVRNMINELVEDSKVLSATLVDANKALMTDTSSVRDSVTQSIETLQKRLEASLEDVLASQTQHMNKVFSNIDASLRDQVGKTGEAVEKQLDMIDQSMQQELNKVMNVMGTKLGQIASQFVKDYSRLTEQMSKVVSKAG
ncbi:MotA/TolQ/ExbB proton channel family protein [Rhodanobacter aciditrophus]|uniref:MotA/TolQ/ExbB proton channel family protein n=1 Tax=Rhodanobacter aciditrophus TaxID=1623218 RepID=A0ABW4B8Z2_9GAMM